MKSLLVVFVLLGLWLSPAAGHKKCNKHGHGKNKCICPDLVILPTNTFTDSALAILNAHGPSDGICLTGEKFFFKGSDFGFDYNVCCCMASADAPVLECNPPGPGIPTCPTAPPPISATETAGEYAIRIGSEYSGIAPENGCCPTGFIKLVNKPAQTLQPVDQCFCIEVPVL